MNDRKRIRGPSTKEDIKTDILLLKKNDTDGKLTAKGIRAKLLKIHPGSKYIPQERAIYNIIKKYKEKLEFNPVDSPWSIGDSEKYNIPADFIGILVEYEQVGQPKFTFREAKWCARLKHIVFETSTPKRPLEDWLSGLIRVSAPRNDPRFALLANIARLYAVDEQIKELKEEKYQDTSDLDFKIFTKGELYGWTTSEIDSMTREELLALGGTVVSTDELESLDGTGGKELKNGK